MFYFLSSQKKDKRPAFIPSPVEAGVFSRENDKALKLQVVFVMSVSIPLYIQQHTDNKTNGVKKGEKYG